MRSRVARSQTYRLAQLVRGIHKHLLLQPQHAKMQMRGKIIHTQTQRRLELCSGFLDLVLRYQHRSVLIVQFPSRCAKFQCSLEFACRVVRLAGTRQHAPQRPVGFRILWRQPNRLPCLAHRSRCIASLLEGAGKVHVRRGIGRINSQRFAELDDRWVHLGLRQQRPAEEVVRNRTVRGEFDRLSKLQPRRAKVAALQIAHSSRYCGVRGRSRRSACRASLCQAIRRRQKNKYGKEADRASANYREIDFHRLQASVMTYNTFCRIAHKGLASSPKQWAGGAAPRLSDLACVLLSAALWEEPAGNRIASRSRISALFG